ncbi:hypothetical protein VPH35_020447 [Triticum aestivum]
MYGASNMVDRLHPESVRVYLITSELVRAIHRGLSLKQGDGPEAARRHTAHLDGLDSTGTARSTPSGKIILHTGCLDLLKTDEEMASIIAHELNEMYHCIGHIVARHSVERNLYRRSWFPSCLRQYLLLPPQELEADHTGILLLGAAGYDPRVAPTTIETIKEKLGSRKACAIHPSTEARLQLLSQHKVMEEALELYREVKANYSLCLTLRSMAASPGYGRFLLGE